MLYLTGAISHSVYSEQKKSPEFQSFSDPDWIQTNDPKLRRFVLYSAELPGLISKDGKDNNLKSKIEARMSKIAAVIIEKTGQGHTHSLFSYRYGTRNSRIPFLISTITSALAFIFSISSSACAWIPSQLIFTLEALIAGNLYFPSVLFNVSAI